MLGLPSVLFANLSEVVCDAFSALIGLDVFDFVEIHFLVSFLIPSWTVFIIALTNEFVNSFF